MGLAELSNHTGLSTAALSKLERDLTPPTLPNLLRIAQVFSVGLDFFFSPVPAPILEIIRSKDRLRFPDAPRSDAPCYYFESLDFPIPNRAMHSYLAEFVSGNGVAGAAGECLPHEHGGFEFLFVQTGELHLTVGTATYQLHEGDAIYFDSSVTHAYSGAGLTNTRVLVTVLQQQQ